LAKFIKENGKWAVDAYVDQSASSEEEEKEEEKLDLPKAAEAATEKVKSAASEVTEEAKKAAETATEKVKSAASSATADHEDL
jgi:protein disulfide-isomerase A1